MSSILIKHIYMVLHGTVPLTLPETNITPENRRLESRSLAFFGKADFFRCYKLVYFQGGSIALLERDPFTNEGGHERTSARSHRDFLRPGRRTASAVFWNARKTAGEETDRRAVVALQVTSRFWMFFFVGILKDEDTQRT